MPEPDYIAPYADATRQAGPSFQALLWHKPEAQAARFDVAIDLAPPTAKAIADLGCGLADFHARLLLRNAGHARYIGVEGVPELAAEAARRLAPQGSRRAHVITADFVADHALFTRLVSDERADILAFSGSLNTLGQPLALEVLDRAWEALARRGRGTLVFNFLSSLCSPARLAANLGPASRFDTPALLAWAAQRTPALALRQDYIPGGHDATLAMHVEA